MARTVKKTPYKTDGLSKNKSQRRESKKPLPKSLMDAQKVMAEFIEKVGRDW